MTFLFTAALATAAIWTLSLRRRNAQAARIEDQLYWTRQVERVNARHRRAGM